MEFEIKTFNELDASELYEILRARAEVFSIEEGIHYLDMDGVDYDALHCFIRDGKRIVAYMRAYSEGNGGAIKLGRVLTTLRGAGYGKELLTRSLPLIRTRTGCGVFTLDSQEHAVGFYLKLGFCITSETFLEAGVPHVKMELSL